MTNCYHLTLDMAALAKALHLSVAQAMRMFADGRVIAKPAEYWVAAATGVTMSLNGNDAMDAYVNLPDGDHMHMAIRVLTSRIRFQRSKRMGAGRSCTLRELRQDIRECDRWAVVDNTGLPDIAIYTFKASLLEGWIDTGELTVGGLSYDDFIAMLFRDGRPRVRQMEFVI